MTLHRLTLAATLPLLASTADAMIPEGYCALIVASRASLAEVQLFELQNPQLTVSEVFESSNGWYAISIGQVAEAAAEGRLATLKQSGTVPPDTYCSTGERYLREVSVTPERYDAPLPPDTSLAAPFDARPMNVEEKRFLQSALAYVGAYAGMLDGEWGRGSQAALDALAIESSGLEATNLDAAILMMVMQEVYRTEGWQYRYFAEYGVSLFLPVGGLQTAGDAAGLSLEHPGMAISIYLTRGGAADVVGGHGYLETQHDGAAELYRVREADRWITAATSGGGAHYLRSESFGSLWTTVLVSAPPAPRSPMNLVVGSITLEPGARLFLPPGGYAQGQVTAVAQLMAEGPGPVAEPVPPLTAANPEPANPPTWATTDPSPSSASSTPAPASIANGTAFYVDALGRALTNAHVIEGCRSVSLGDDPAEVLAVSRENDLAVLAPISPEGNYSYLAFSSQAAALNSDVTVAGFPLQPLLGTLNVTRGSVSSLTGLGGDVATMQITAPVQPGNSGGPVVDRHGRVVGVVVAKIDLGFALETFGSVPENVNFAIRSDLAKLFLSAHGFGFEEADTSVERTPEALAAELERATALVTCSQ